MALALLLAAFVIGGLVFIHLYNRYARLIDERLSGQIFAHPSILFAAPEKVMVGETITPQAIARELRQAGYSEHQASPVGAFRLTAGQIGIQPGPSSFHSPEPTVITFASGQIAAITDPTTGLEMPSYRLEPEVLTTLYNRRGVKRQLLHYRDLPPDLIHALLATEDRYFFQHGAIDWLRIPAAMYRDIRAGYKEQGASTLAMQVARNFFLTPKKTYVRKLEEMLIAIELEQRFTKQHILTLYANEVYEGQHGTYAIRGFGEAAKAYFGIKVQQVTLPQAALLTGMLHGPSLDDPYVHPHRALARRNFVLHMMRKDGFISRAQEKTARATPIRLAPLYQESGDAPYFVGMVQDELSRSIPARQLLSQSFHIYTTLDPRLQAIATQAVNRGLKQVDALLARRKMHRVLTAHGWRWVRWVHKAGEKPEAALIAIDPHTGAVKALVGGSDYALSQLNHIFVVRPTGSIFKPFVYAAALNTALDGSSQAITESSTLMDEPTTFAGGYQPANFENEYMGKVTLWQALEHSLNNATISLATEVGYNKVVDLARAAGIRGIEPTPAMAIGSYGASPWAMAQGYTVFANGGVMVRSRLIYAVKNHRGVEVMRDHARATPLLDPRVAFLVDNLMQSVITHGTGAGVAALGLNAPLYGKTGTAHDGWFAGFSSNLECLVWVGLNDYRNLNLQGANSALPIWAEFMKGALSLPQYANPAPIAPPPGIVSLTLDRKTLRPVSPLCPSSSGKTRVVYYIAGTQPSGSCIAHAIQQFPHALVRGVARLFGHSSSAPPPPPRVIARYPAVRAPAPAAQSLAPPKPAKKKKGFWGKVFGIFGSKKTPPRN